MKLKPNLFRFPKLLEGDSNEPRLHRAHHRKRYNKVRMREQIQQEYRLAEQEQTFVVVDQTALLLGLYFQM